jgi:solute carrier family 13 (sodium-dependent dicarboxylate transporter), member 2/3/5
VDRIARILLGPAASLLTFLLLPSLPWEARFTAAVTVLMAAWWILEAIPLEATALIPLVAFPLAGVLSASEAAVPYADRVIILFLGGFLIAVSMERWDLHRRVALLVISLVGTGPRRIVLGFMVATAGVSLFISNTAAAMMMIPIALALATTVATGSGAGGPADGSPSFARCLILSVAYAASIGGVGTLIGSPPNGIFAAQLAVLFPEAPQVDFFTWLLFGIPFVAIFIPLAWLWLTRGAFRDLPERIPLAGEVIRREREALGPLSRGEMWTLLVFLMVGLAWIFQDTKVIGGIVIPGLDQVFPGITDATIAIAGAILLFLLPVDIRKGEFTMDWEHAVKIPWGILILFGGGLALSSAIVKSGLAEAMVGPFSHLQGIPLPLIILVLVTAVIFLTEITSNTALASIMMPVTAVLAVTLGVNPVFLMLTVAVAASLAFMLPVGTPPNAIAHGTGRVPLRVMVRTGFTLNLMAIALWTLFSLTYLPWVLGISPALPGWAVP